MTELERFAELLECWKDSAKQDRCTIVDSNTYWEGERYTQTVYNGDSMTVAGMTIPLSTQFLLCSVHEIV